MWLLRGSLSVRMMDLTAWRAEGPSVDFGIDIIGFVGIWRSDIDGETLGFKTAPHMP